MIVMVVMMTVMIVMIVMVVIIIVMVVMMTMIVMIGRAIGCQDIGRAIGYQRMSGGVRRYRYNKSSELTWLSRHMSAIRLVTFPCMILSIISFVGSFPLPVLNFRAIASSLCCLQRKEWRERSAEGGVEREVWRR